jgi:ornithine cyclodeaminase/alanine dehydrogenase-like protein (mu-crystallin family)
VRANSGAGAFVLSHSEIARLLQSVAIGDLARELVSAVEATYGDRYLRSLTRAGWTQELDTLEVMGCRSFDYSCVKIISSNPSLAGANTPIVSGTLVCTEVGSDQARLVCDTGILTAFRTAAGTAAALKRLKPNALSITIIGSGLEGAAHASVLALILPHVERISFIDRDSERAQQASNEVKTLLSATSVIARLWPRPMLRPADSSTLTSLSLQPMA